MVNMTLSMPDEVKEAMDEHPEIKWSEVARRAIIEKIALLKRADELASKSKLTQKDVDEIGRKIKIAANKRLKR